MKAPVLTYATPKGKRASVRAEMNEMALTAAHPAEWWWLGQSSEVLGHFERFFFKIENGREAI